MESKKQKNELIDTGNQLVAGGRVVGKMSEAGQKVQASSDRVSLSWDATHSRDRS